MRQKFRISGEIVDTVVVLNGGAGTVTIGDCKFEVTDVVREGSELRFTCQGRCHTFNVLDTADAVLLTDGVSYHSFPRIEPGLEDVGEEAGGELTSKMPGTVLQTLVEAGTQVTKGTPVMILEAMKMEHEVCVPTDGVVDGYPFKPGDRVMPGDLLVDFSPLEVS